ncbi:MAG: flagellar biosynthetic protein FliO [Leptospirales bacterium]
MNPVHAHHTSLLWVAGRLVGSLLLVVVLFLGAVWLLRFLQKKTQGGSSSSKNESISVRTTVALAPKTTLSVVSVGEESFLIGVTPQSVSLLSRLSSGREEARPPGEPQRFARLEEVSVSPTLDRPGEPMDRRTPERPVPRYAPGPPSAPPELRKEDQEENFENLVQGALDKIRKGRKDRDGSSPSSRRWSV